MNIFALDYDPAEAAKYHLDKHVVKMPLETAQMLSTIQNKFGYKTRYKPTHVNHPCTLWAEQSASNYAWLVELGFELCAEYSYRYNRIHACQAIINDLSKPPIEMLDIGFTEFAMAMPDECKDSNPVTAYRNYYRLYKAHIANWTHRNVPEWMEELYAGKV